MEEERGPADNKDPNQYGQGDRPLHVAALADGARTWQHGDPLHVQPGHEEHVDVERGHESHHGEGHADEADDDHTAVGVNDKQNARHGASCPDTTDDDTSPLNRHDVMVLESVKDGKVPVHCDGKQAADRREQGATDHGVNDIVNIHCETLGVGVCTV